MGHRTSPFTGIGTSGAALLLLAGLAQPLMAVQRSADHEGQYLILPFAIATERYDTLLQVNTPLDYYVDADDPAQRAVKLRILDRDGTVAATGSLYLDIRTSWAAALSRNDDGSARLATASDACFLAAPEGGGNVAPVTELELDFRFGSVEFVEMGTVADFQSPLAGWIDDGDCQAIADAWNDPLWEPDGLLAAPAGGLRASASVISVADGTMYSLTATALEDFSSIGQHRAPGDPLPDLASAFDAGTPQGATESVLCLAGGCVTDTWEEPIDAVAAALMVHEARADFLISESIGARTEFVLNFPVMPYRESPHPMASTELALGIRDRAGTRYGTVTDIPIPTPPPSPFDFHSPSFRFGNDGPLDILDFNSALDEAGSTQASNLLGVEHFVRFPGNPQSPDSGHVVLPDSGQAMVGLENAGSLLQHPSGRIYLGQPVIMIVLQEYTNGVLPGPDGEPQRANYGNAFVPSTVSRISE